MFHKGLGRRLMPAVADGSPQVPEAAVWSSRKQGLGTVPRHLTMHVGPDSFFEPVENRSLL